MRGSRGDAGGPEEAGRAAERLLAVQRRPGDSAAALRHLLSLRTARGSTRSVWLPKGRRLHLPPQSREPAQQEELAACSMLEPREGAAGDGTHGWKDVRTDGGTDGKRERSAPRLEGPQQLPQLALAGEGWTEPGGSRGRAGTSTAPCP